MKLYMLVAYNSGDTTDVRYRLYTRNVKRADVFSRIPRILIADSLGIVFQAREVPAKTWPEVYGVRSCVDHIRMYAPKFEWK